MARAEKENGGGEQGVEKKGSGKISEIDVIANIVLKITRQGAYIMFDLLRGIDGEEETGEGVGELREAGGGAGETTGELRCVGRQLGLV